MVEAIKTGKSVKAVAAEFGRCVETVRRACRSAGIRPAPRLNIMEAVAIIRSGEHLDVVAKRYGIPYPYGPLYRACRVAGVRWTVRSGLQRRPWLRAAIVERVREGWSATDIADDLDVSTTTVYASARDAGLVFRKLRQNPAAKRRDIAIQLLRDGSTIGDVMRKMGAKRKTVLQYAAAAGVTPPDKGGRKLRSESERRQIIKLWRSGVSLRAVAARLDLTPGAVSGAISRAGEQRKNWGRNPNIENQIAV